MFRFEKYWKCLDSRGELDGREAYESVDGVVGDSGGEGVLGEGGLEGRYPCSEVPLFLISEVPP